MYRAHNRTDEQTALRVTREHRRGLTPEPSGFFHVVVARIGHVSLHGNLRAPRTVHLESRTGRQQQHS